MRTNIWIATMALVGIFIILLSGGCGTVIGNGAVSLEFDTYDAQARSAISPLSGMSQLKMCLKQVRFKTSADSLTPPVDDPDNIAFEVGEITLSASGTALGQVSVPSGTYTRIELDLDSRCAAGKSIQLSNPQGSFSSTATITIKFTGMFTARGQNGRLRLNVQPIVSALNSVDSDDDIEGQAELNNGDFDDGDFNTNNSIVR